MDGASFTFLSLVFSKSSSYSEALSSWCTNVYKFLSVLPHLQATKAGAASMIHYTALILARLVLLTLCGWVLCWTLVNLFRSHSVLNLLFLGYP